MGKILIVRFPKNTNPEQLKESYESTRQLLGSEYIVLPFVTEVEKTEVEIVYDPYFKAEELQSGSFERIDTFTPSLKKHP